MRGGIILESILHRSLGLALSLATLLPPTMGVSAQAPSPERIHEVLSTFVRSAATRPLPSGDTLVSWYKQPILLHLVERTPDHIAEAMIRGEAYLGTASVTYRAGRPVSGAVLWTSGDSVAAQVRFTTTPSTLTLEGTTNAQFASLAAPWGIADYGMEDLLLPTLQALAGVPQPWTVLVYRPFAAKWDTLTVTTAPVSDASLITLTSRDGRRDWWLLSAEGALVQMLREGQDFERRPLELTPLWAVYQRLLPLVPPR